jgi:hypothetical protein
VPLLAGAMSSSSDDAPPRAKRSRPAVIRVCGCPQQGYALAFVYIYIIYI